MQSRPLFARQSSGMIRELSWLDVFIMSVAAPAASGILYYSVNTQSSYPGGSIVLAFLIGMIIFLPISHVIAMLATATPRAGSLYVSVSRLMDSSVAFIGAYLYIVGQALVAGVLGNIVMVILGGILVGTSEAYNLKTLKDIGIAFQGHTAQIVGGIFLVFLFWLVSSRGIRVFKKVMQVFFYVPLTATILAILVFLFTSPSGAVESFNNTWGVNAYQQILAAARSGGWSAPPFSLAATFSLLLVVLWAYNGIDMGSYSGTEVQSPKRSFLKGVMLGWICVGALYVILTLTVERTFGDFLSAYDYLVKNDNGNLLAGIMPKVTPSVPFYLISVTGNKILGLLLSLSLVLWFVNSIPPIFMSTSRLIFALSMDRLLPESFSNVNLKNGAPTNATHLVAAIAIAGVVFQTYNVKVVLGTILFCTFFIFWMYGYSAMILPYKRPDIYAQMPPQEQVFGLPLITISGSLTFAISWFFMFLSMREVTIPICIALAVIMSAGIILYLGQVVRNHKRGVSLNEIMNQLPPED